MLSRITVGGHLRRMPTYGQTWVQRAWMSSTGQRLLEMDAAITSATKAFLSPDWKQGQVTLREVLDKLEADYGAAIRNIDLAQQQVLAHGMASFSLDGNDTVDQLLSESKCTAVADPPGYAYTLMQRASHGMAIYKHMHGHFQEAEEHYERAHSICKIRSKSGFGDDSFGDMVGVMNDAAVNMMMRQETMSSIQPHLRHSMYMCKRAYVTPYLQEAATLTTVAYLSGLLNERGDMKSLLTAAAHLMSRFWQKQGIAGLDEKLAGPLESEVESEEVSAPAESALEDEDLMQRFAAVVHACVMCANTFMVGMENKPHALLEPLGVAKRILERRLGQQDHPLYLRLVLLESSALLRAHKAAEAAALLRPVYPTYKATLPSHPDRIAALNNIALASTTAKAARYLAKAESLCQQDDSKYSRVATQVSNNKRVCETLSKWIDVSGSRELANEPMLNALITARSDADFVRDFHKGVTPRVRVSEPVLAIAFSGLADVGNFLPVRKGTNGWPSV